MKPNLELARVRDDQSFEIWSHSHPCRTVQWHLHPEYDLHPGRADLATSGICRAVGFNNILKFSRMSPAAKGVSPLRFRTLRRDGRRLAAMA